MSGRITVQHGDSREVLRQFPDNHFDSVVTDPPYALVSIVKRFGKNGAAPAKGNSAYMRASAGFMGQQWDNGSTAFDPEFWAEVLRVLKPGGHIVAFSGTRTYHRMACAIEDAGFEIRDQIGWAYGSGFPKSHNAGNGWGTALKPAWEPIVLGRRPLIGTVAANMGAHGTGAMNIDGCRVDGPGAAKWDTPRGGIWSTDSEANEALVRNDKGRWPANLVHDGSDEVVALFPDSDGQQGDVRGTEPSAPTNGIYGDFAGRPAAAARNDSGSAARFFYTAKADADDRLGSKHPTVKPVDLMQWLVRLVTPPGGLVLDPFAGTGTTGEAAFREGMRCTLIEREERFVADIHRRIDLLLAGPEERGRTIIKAKISDGRIKDDAGPLFGGDELERGAADRFMVTSPIKTSDWPEAAKA
jgi:site-specific DNA-methyltransferase (adenine-specific)